ncbi:MAG: hypothetical protein ISS29_09240 [Candidatus Marinimicrobia bacterium]|nr:hypothetical protein [Candidatus Neomarinimicrobiota bacterium]
MISDEKVEYSAYCSSLQTAQKYRVSRQNIISFSSFSAPAFGPSASKPPTPSRVLSCPRNILSSNPYWQKYLAYTDDKYQDLLRHMIALLVII